MTRDVLEEILFRVGVHMNASFILDYWEDPSGIYQQMYAEEKGWTK